MKEDFRIPVFFLIAGILWITFSDQWLFSLPFNIEQQAFISKSKGFLFVSVSTFFLFFLIKHSNRKLIKEQYNLNLQTEENRKLFEILNKVQSSIIFSDPEGKITWVNRSFETSSGYSLDDVINRHPREVLRGSETGGDAAEKIDASLREGTSCSTEILIYKKTGEKYWINTNITPLFNHDHKLTGFLSIQTDVTEYRLLEQKLSQQNTLLRNITWMASHDIRKPLSSILSLVELIESGTEQERTECLLLLARSADDLDKTICSVSNKINELERQ